MSLAPGADTKWVPTSATAAPIPTPADRVAVLGTDFLPYYFAVNAAVIAQTAKMIDLSEAQLAVVDHLHEQGCDHTRATPNGGLQGFADFPYASHGKSFPKGHGGAFITCFMMCGWIMLHEATGRSNYLERAKRLAHGLIDTEATDRAYHIHEELLWFDEIVSGSNRVPVYNGHILAVASLSLYREYTGDHTLDDFIRAGVSTMARWLPLQIRPEGYFCYSRDAPEIRDYGQDRAVLLTRMLAEITGDAMLEGIAASFQSHLDHWKCGPN